MAYERLAASDTVETAEPTANRRWRGVGVAAVGTLVVLALLAGRRERPSPASSQPALSPAFPQVASDPPLSRKAAHAIRRQRELPQELSASAPERRTRRPQQPQATDATYDKKASKVIHDAQEDPTSMFDMSTP